MTRSLTGTISVLDPSLIPSAGEVLPASELGGWSVQLETEQENGSWMGRPETDVTVNILNLFKRF
jgi:hypothetical protein